MVLSSTEVLPALKEYIDNANIPTTFGGRFPFTHGMLPELDNNIWQHFSWRLLSRSLPPGPIKWTEDVNGRKIALAVGGEAGSKRTEKVVVLDTIKE